MWPDAEPDRPLSALPAHVPHHIPQMPTNPVRNPTPTLTLTQTQVRARTHAHTHPRTAVLTHLVGGC